VDSLDIVASVGYRGTVVTQEVEFQATVASVVNPATLGIVDYLGTLDIAARDYPATVATLVVGYRGILVIVVSPAIVGLLVYLAIPGSVVNLVIRGTVVCPGTPATVVYLAIVGFQESRVTAA
jgi:hypothetical protein